MTARALWTSRPVAWTVLSGSSARIDVRKARRRFVWEYLRMTAKEYLRQLKNIEIKKAQRRQERDRLIAEAMGNNSPRLTVDKVQSSCAGDQMGDKLADAADIQREVDRLINKLIADRHRIIGEIHSLTDARYIQILYLHYVEGKKLEDVAEIMVKTNGKPYSYDHIASLHGMALQEFDRVVLKSHGIPK